MGAAEGVVALEAELVEGEAGRSIVMAAELLKGVEGRPNVANSEGFNIQNPKPKRTSPTTKATKIVVDVDIFCLGG